MCAIKGKIALVERLVCRNPLNLKSSGETFKINFKGHVFWMEQYVSSDHLHILSSRRNMRYRHGEVLIASIVANKNMLGRPVFPAIFAK